MTLHQSRAARRKKEPNSRLSSLTCANTALACLIKLLYISEGLWYCQIQQRINALKQEGIFVSVCVEFCWSCLGVFPGAGPSWEPLDASAVCVSDCVEPQLQNQRLHCSGWSSSRARPASRHSHLPAGAVGRPSHGHDAQIRGDDQRLQT